MHFPSQPERVPNSHQPYQAAREITPEIKAVLLQYVELGIGWALKYRFFQKEDI